MHRINGTPPEDGHDGQPLSPPKKRTKGPVTKEALTTMLDDYNATLASGDECFLLEQPPTLEDVKLVVQNYNNSAAMDDRRALIEKPNTRLEMAAIMRVYQNEALADEKLTFIEQPRSKRAMMRVVDRFNMKFDVAYVIKFPENEEEMTASCRAIQPEP